MIFWKKVSIFYDPCMEEGREGEGEGGDDFVLVIFF